MPAGAIGVRLVPALGRGARDEDTHELAHVARGVVYGEPAEKLLHRALLRDLVESVRAEALERRDDGKLHVGRGIVRLGVRHDLVETVRGGRVEVVVGFVEVVEETAGETVGEERGDALRLRLGQQRGKEPKAEKTTLVRSADHQTVLNLHVPERFERPGNALGALDELAPHRVHLRV